MSSDLSEYRSQPFSPLSPLSPLPVHPVEPTEIPVLRNQTDPVFNMTSTHIESGPGVQLPSHISASLQQPAPQPGSPSSDSSFTDAYGEQNGTEVDKEEKLGQDAVVIDDYAMTFDSDEEDQGQIQDVSQAVIDSKTDSLPISIKDSSSTASAVDIAHDTPSDVLQNGPNTSSHPFCSSQSAHPTATEPSIEIPLSFPDPTRLEEESSPPTYDDASNDGVDIQQLLDNITANAEKNESASSAQPIVPPSISLPAHASLPPRPQISLARAQDDKHTFANTAGLPPASSSYRPPAVAASLVAAGAPGTSTDPRGGLPPPPSASYSPVNRSGQDHLIMPIDTRDEADHLDKRWGPEIQKKYDAFLEDERKNVLEGAWDKFPYGSRLFVGNLASEMVTKRDIYHIFHMYGKIAQVSIKNQYGFVQYYDVAACNEALKHQEGVEVRGKKIHLEVSKPQKASNNQQRPAGGSGDFPRGGQNDRNGRQPRNSNDRYDGRQATTARPDEFGRQPRTRDDYRQPRRSISPGRGNGRNRDTYAPRARDSYSGARDGRDHRERSPPSYNGRQNYRERSPSPVRRERNADADLPFPLRDPRNIPDVQLIVIEQINGAFVSWVENELKVRGIKTEAMFLNPRISLDAVIQRQVLEGVHAVTLLDLSSQNTNRISLRVFNRQDGANNVRFDEYQGLEPKIAAELVLREKQLQTTVPAYAPPPFSQAQVYQPPAATPVAPNIANLVGNMDNATLQKLLSSLNTAQHQTAPASAANAALDLVGLLGSLNQQQQPQQVYQQQPAPYANYPVHPPAPSYNTQPAPAQPQQEQSVQNIMAVLAKYR